VAAGLQVGSGLLREWDFWAIILLNGDCPERIAARMGRQDFWGD
tara:strand:- start:147 stop:278 length:132 start_codon:yes stop_codon:yes gene_type:complete